MTPSSAKPFANSTRVEASARFSPDGRRIAFASFRSGGRRSGSRPRWGRNSANHFDRTPRRLVVAGWSPDGTRILFDAAIDGNSDVYDVGADGGQLRRVTSEASIEGVPSWSHDGRWIYFSSTRAGVTPDSGAVCRRRGGPAHYAQRRFEAKESPDGQYLFYLAGRSSRPVNDPTAKLMRMPVAGGPEQVVLGARAAVSLVGHRRWYRLRHPRSGLRRDRSVSVQRSARHPRGPARISPTGHLHAHVGVARWAVGVGDEDGAVRFGSHAARQFR